MRKLLQVLVATSMLTAIAAGQQASPGRPSAAPASSTPAASTPAASTPADAMDDYSGMYSFLREGEFVQVTVEDAGHVTGFVSRYGDRDSDQGAFLDQFFKQAKLDGHSLSFTTETVHGIWFEFQGQVERGSAKTRTQEGYYVLKGTLIEYAMDEAKRVSAKTREVEFKLFPEDAGPAPPKRD
jgi:hypothetical protein